MIINEHSKDILSVPWTDSRSNEFGIRLNNSDYPFQQKKFSSVRMAWSICSKKNVICLNSLCYLLNGLGYPFQKKLSPVRMAWAIRLKKIVIRSKKKLSTVRATEAICSKINLAKFLSQNNFVASHSRQTICTRPEMIPDPK